MKNTQVIWFLLSTILLSSFQYASATEAKLSKVSPDEMKEMISKYKPILSRFEPSDVEYFAEQSFIVELDGKPFDKILAFKLRPKKPGSQICGLAFLPSNAKREIYQIFSIGVDDFEAISCTAPSDAGVIQMAKKDAPKIVYIFKAESPNAEVNQPIVISYNKKSKQFFLDSDLTRKLEAKGAKSISDAQAVLLK